MIKYYPIVLLLLIICSASCSRFDEFENLEGTDVQPEFAVPLIQSRVVMKDLLEKFDDDSFIEIDPDGLIHFMYSGDVLSQGSEVVFAAIQESLPPGFPVTDTVMALPFGTLDGVALDKIEFKTGTMQYGFVSEHDDDMSVIVRLPQLKKDGVVFERLHGTSPALGGVPLPFPEPLDMAGYTLETEGDSIYVEYIAMRNGVRDTVSNFLMSFSNMTFAYAEGYLGQQVYDSAIDTIEIDFFDEWKEGRVYFEDPTIDIRVDNSFGIPTRSIVETFEVITVDGTPLPLESEVTTGGGAVDFDYPEPDEAGTTKTTLYTFTTENSNIADILGSTPSALIYDVDAYTNPDSNQTIRGFITCDSRFTINVHVDLPLHVQASGFLVSDTFDINFLDYDEVEQVEFKIVTENELGVSIAMQAYFTDENGVVLDQLLSETTNIIDAAPVDSEGVVTEMKKVETFITFDKARFEKVRNATGIILDTEFSTLNEGDTSVKIFAEEGVNIRMGMKVGL